MGNRLAVALRLYRNLSESRDFDRRTKFQGFLSDFVKHCCKCRLGAIESTEMAMRFGGEEGQGDSSLVLATPCAKICIQCIQLSCRELCFAFQILDFFRRSCMSEAERQLGD
jgi:hypothetical protein